MLLSMECDCDHDPGFYSGVPGGDVPEHHIALPDLQHCAAPGRSDQSSHRNPEPYCFHIGYEEGILSPKADAGIPCEDCQLSLPAYHIGQ